MKRLTVHSVFAVLSVASAATALWSGVQLQQAQRLNGAITAAAAAPASAASPTPRDAPRTVRLARANALAKAQSHDAALQAYSGVIEPGAPDALGRDALFNLGNMLLRQALAQGAGTGRTAEALPLVELAKQRYRDVLRAAPQDWDARYNLERALRLAPEEEALAEETNEPAERRRVMLRGMDAGDLP